MPELQCVFQKVTVIYYYIYIDKSLNLLIVEYQIPQGILVPLIPLYPLPLPPPKTSISEFLLLPLSFVIHYWEGHWQESNLKLHLTTSGLRLKENCC